MRIITLSDLHLDFPDVGDLPSAEGLVFAGDATHSGRTLEWALWDAWWEEIRGKFPYTYWIPGNHDFCPSRSAFYADMGGGRGAWDALDIWGNSTTGVYSEPWSGQEIPVGERPRWWYAAGTAQERREVWEGLPENLDILVTHGPPRGPWRDWEMTRRLLDLQSGAPYVHIYGHVHESGGEVTVAEWGSLEINASGRGPWQSVTHAALEIEFLYRGKA